MLEVIAASEVKRDLYGVKACLLFSYGKSWVKLPIAPFVTENFVVELIDWRLGPHRLTVK
jgi:hypothetical protein